MDGDIKLLERVDANGLEQWRPTLKEPFPLADSALAQFRAALGLIAPPPSIAASRPGGDGHG